MSNVDLIRSLYDAFGRGDVPTVVSGLHPDIEWREAEGNPYQPSGEPFRGPDAIVQGLFAPLVSDFPDFVIHPKLFHDAGDTVVVEVRYTATHGTTGKSLDAQACHVYTVRDGKVTSFQQYVDTAQLQDVMGAR